MSVEMIARTRPRIIIVGGGFAGAYCARALQKRLKQSDADILLIDPRNHFIFYPLLVEAGVGSLEPRHVVVGIRQYLSRRVRFRMGRVTDIDFAKQVVAYRVTGTERVRKAEYDHLVLAPGSSTMMPPVPGLRGHAFEIKSVPDAIGLRDRAIQLLEQANVETDDAKRRALLHFVVVGASFTGVEVAGEFNEFLRSATRQYRNLKPSDCQVTLVDLSDRILPALSRSLSEYARDKLEEGGAQILLNSTVNEVRADNVIVNGNERLDAHTLVWCAGIAQNPLSKRLDLPKDDRGYVLCERDLRVRGKNNVWAIGDTAVNTGPDGSPYPATAQHATREGKHVADNIARALSGHSLIPCDLTNLGALAPLGCRTAVAEVFGLRFSGFPAWWLWRTVYLMKMPTLGRKVRVAMDWSLDLFFKRDTTQLGMHRDRHNID